MIDRHTRTEASTDRGFTFLIVIWVLSIFVVLALVFGAAVSSHIKITRNTIENAKAEALADAGIGLAVIEMTAWRANPLRQSWLSDANRSKRCSVEGGGWLRLIAEDESGKIDLNIADERLVEAALLAAGISADDVTRYSQRIVDYRDSDSLRRPQGAEAEEYRERGLAGPKNFPFDVIEEVEQVIDMPLGLADALRPYVTVYSGQVTVNLQLAHPRLQTVLSSRQFQSGLNDGENFLDSRRQAGSSSSTNFLSAAGGGRAFRIVSEARTAEGALFVREAIVEFLQTQPGAFAYRRWRKGTATDIDGPVSRFQSLADLPRC
jgi:general secretion pathway protein K